VIHDINEENEKFARLPKSEQRLIISKQALADAVKDILTKLHVALGWNYESKNTVENKLNAIIDGQSTFNESSWQARNNILEIQNKFAMGKVAEAEFELSWETYTMGPVDIMKPIHTAIGYCINAREHSKNDEIDHAWWAVAEAKFYLGIVTAMAAGSHTPTARQLRKHMSRLNSDKKNDPYRAAQKKATDLLADRLANTPWKTKKDAFNIIYVDLANYIKECKIPLSHDNKDALLKTFMGWFSKAHLKTIAERGPPQPAK
jgi:hypothetical protein